MGHFSSYKQVGDNRRNFFTPMLKGETYNDINSQLRDMSLNWSKSRQHPDFKERTIFEVYEEEKPYLIPYRCEFTAYRVHPTVVSPLSMVNYDTNMYSVECAYVGLAVQIKSYAWSIMILHEGKIIGHHIRCFARYQKIYNPWHYVPALERKPGALRNGAPFKALMNLLPSAFSRIRHGLESYKDSDKQFVAILVLVNKYGLEKVTNACNQAIVTGGCSVKLVEQYLQPVAQITQQETEFIQLQNPPDEDCSIYSELYLCGEKI